MTDTDMQAVVSNLETPFQKNNNVATTKVKCDIGKAMLTMLGGKGTHQ